MKNHAKRGAVGPAPDEEYDFLDDEEDVLRGLEDPKFRRRRRGSGGGTFGPAVIVIVPNPFTAHDTDPIGTVVGTVSVVGGFGTYSFSFVDPTGRFNLVGNQVQVASALSSGFYNVTINATNGQGDNPSFPTVIYVTHVTSYVPTYYLYGF